MTFSRQELLSHVSTEGSCVTLYRPTCSHSFLVILELNLDVYVSHV